MKLSSSSVASYHVQKLSQMKLIREQAGPDGMGYVAEEAVFEAMLRIRRTVIPVWTTATVFFAAALVALVTALRPSAPGASYVFSLVVIAVALAISLYETVTSVSSDRI